MWLFMSAGAGGSLGHLQLPWVSLSTCGSQDPSAQTASTLLGLWAQLLSLGRLHTHAHICTWTGQCVMQHEAIQLRSPSVCMHVCMNTSSSYKPCQPRLLVLKKPCQASNMRVHVHLMTRPRHLLARVLGHALCHRKAHWI